MGKNAGWKSREKGLFPKEIFWHIPAGARFYGAIRKLQDDSAEISLDRIGIPRYHVLRRFDITLGLDGSAIRSAV